MSHHFKIHTPFVRNLRSGELFEIFLVTAVSTILVVRGYLELTGYPQLGDETLHIAHVLPGGLLMAVAIVLALGYLNREARVSAAVLGGVGFGLFIDELGKFLTKNTDYFFAPTVALIYVVFIVLFLGIRWIEDRRTTEQEYVINALESAKQVALHGLDKAERKIALRYLKHARRNDPTVRALRDLLAQLHAAPDPAPGRVARCRRWLDKRYRSLIERPWFTRALIIWFAAGAVLSLIYALFFVFDQPANVTFAEWGDLAASAVTGLFVLVGIFKLVRHSRLSAYEWFRRAVLISLFLTQFFIFYDAQFAGLVRLVITLLVLVALQYAIKQERYGR